MELLTNSKTEYLLDVPLEVLHAETLAWIKELHFWANEVSFFYRLLHHNEVSNVFPSEQLADIDKELVKLNGERLDPIRAGMASHERMLASLFNPPSVADEQAYRENHRRLNLDMYILHQEIRQLKQRVCSFF